MNAIAHPSIYGYVQNTPDLILAKIFILRNIVSCYKAFITVIKSEYLIAYDIVLLLLSLILYFSDDKLKELVELTELNDDPNNENILEESCKLRFTLALLKELTSKGHRTLLFSTSLKILDFVQSLLQDEVAKYVYSRCKNNCQKI